MSFLITSDCDHRVRHALDTEEPAKGGEDIGWLYWQGVYVAGSSLCRCEENTRFIAVIVWWNRRNEADV
jgi:hypothetical protein